MGGYVNDIAVSPDGQMVCIGYDDGIIVANVSGESLWTHETAPVNSVFITKDSTIVADYGGQVILLDVKGNKLRQWPDTPIYKGVALAEGASLILIATNEGINCYSFSEAQLQWSYPWSFLRSIQTTASGNTIVAGTDDGDILFLDSKGRLIQRLEPGGRISGLAVDDDGTLVAAVDCDGDRILLYRNADGELLWETKTTPESNGIVSVRMSSDGNSILCDMGSELVLLDSQGKELERHDLNEPVTALAMNLDWTVMMAGGVDGRVDCLTSDPQLFSDAMLPSLRAICGKIRRSYLANQATGICLWFHEFDGKLRSGSLDHCELLLGEILEGYALDPFDEACVKSRQGALLIARGIAHHRAGSLEAARDFYRQGLQIHTEVNNVEGQGQARLLLSALDESATEIPSDILGQLRVLGSAEALLTRRVETGSPQAQRAAVLAARQFGYLEPLVTALSSSDHVADSAAAALGFLQPGPDTETLLRALNHENWFVRWRVASLLRQREESPTAELLSAVFSLLVSESDPAVKHNLLRIVANSTDKRSVKVVLPLLRDPDADVRHAACRTLQAIGDLRAIRPLEQAQPGYAYFDNGTVEEAAGSALEEIRSRYPPPEISDVTLSRRLLTDDGEIAMPTQYFPASIPYIYGQVTLAHYLGKVSADLQSSAHNGQDFILNITLKDGAEWSGTPAEPEGGDENDSDFSPDALSRLVELLPEEHSENDSEDGVVNFVIPRPPEGWQPVAYGLSVYFLGEQMTYHSFMIVDETPIERVAMVSGIPGTANQETEVLIAGAKELRTIVTMSGFVGLQIRSEIFNGSGELVSEASAYFTDEYQEEIILHWGDMNWLPGHYAAIITSETGSNNSCEFQVVEAVNILSAGLQRPAGPGNPIRVNTEYFLPEEDFELSVELSMSPQQFPISAEWFCNGVRIGDGPITELTNRSGRQQATFTFHCPSDGWPTEEYSVTISLGGRVARTVNFRVIPPPLSRRIIAATESSYSYLKSKVTDLRRALPVRSGVTWGLIWAVFRISDLLVSAVVGTDVVLSTTMLALVHEMISWSPVWWLLGGGLYGVFGRAAIAAEKGRYFQIAQLLLTGIVVSLLAFQVVHLVFGLGYVWPQALGGLFGKVLFGRHLYAWADVFLITILCFVSYTGKVDKWKLACFMTLLIIPICYLLSLLTAAFFGGSLWLMVVLFSKHWAQAVWGIGIQCGFVIGTIRAIYDIARSGSKSKGESNIK